MTNVGRNSVRLSLSILSKCFQLTTFLNILFFFRKKALTFLQIVSVWDNLHKTSKPCFLGKMSSICSITESRLFKYNESFTTKNKDFIQKFRYIFHISAQNIECGYSLETPCQGDSNEYPQSMILCRNKDNNVYPCKPQFCYIKVGFKGAKII